MQEENNKLSLKMTELQLTLESQAKALAAATQTLKSLAKETQKVEEKKKKKVLKTASSEKKTSPFDKTVNISDELSDFLGVERGERVSRQFVTAGINNYVKVHGIQDPTNGRLILTSGSPPAEALNALLKPDQPLTFFNMQRYLKPHYELANKTDVHTTGKNATDHVVDEPMDVKENVVMVESVENEHQDENLKPVQESSKKKIKKK